MTAKLNPALEHRLRLNTPLERPILTGHCWYSVDGGRSWESVPADQVWQRLTECYTLVDADKIFIAIRAGREVRVNDKHGRSVRYRRAQRH